MSFADHFSKQSTDYAKYRPGYPPELYAWLKSLTAMHDLAWDVGTGNGQAAVELAGFFKHVVATDPSSAQIENAQPHSNVAYKVQPAEQSDLSDLSDGSVDLVTIAQALHWFDFDRFYAQVNRVLKPGGAIAAWTYTLNKVTPSVDAVTNRFYADIVGPYWPPERRYIEASYRDIPFPFAEIAVAPIYMVTRWTYEDYIGYLYTWSATQRYIKAKQQDPIDSIRQPLLDAWGAQGGIHEVTWPIHIRAGRMYPAS